jgi:hypothetical protein
MLGATQPVGGNAGDGRSDVRAASSEISPRVQQQVQQHVEQQTEQQTKRIWSKCFATTGNDLIAINVLCITSALMAEVYLKERSQKQYGAAALGAFAGSTVLSFVPALLVNAIVAAKGRDRVGMPREAEAILKLAIFLGGILGAIPAYNRYFPWYHVQQNLQRFFEHQLAGLATVSVLLAATAAVAAAIEMATKKASSPVPAADDVEAPAGSTSEPLLSQNQPRTAGKYPELQVVNMVRAIFKNL